MLGSPRRCSLHILSRSRSSRSRKRPQLQSLRLKARSNPLKFLRLETLLLTHPHSSRQGRCVVRDAAAAAEVVPEGGKGNNLLQHRHPQVQKQLELQQPPRPSIRRKA
jgi:hypothetical protein